MKSTYCATIRAQVGSAGGPVAPARARAVILARLHAIAWTLCLILFIWLKWTQPIPMYGWWKRFCFHISFLLSLINLDSNVVSSQPKIQLQIMAHTANVAALLEDELSEQGDDWSNADWPLESVSTLLVPPIYLIQHDNLNLRHNEHLFDHYCASFQVSLLLRA